MGCNETHTLRPPPSCSYLCFADLSQCPPRSLRTCPFMSRRTGLIHPSNRAPRTCPTKNNARIAKATCASWAKMSPSFSSKCHRAFRCCAMSVPKLSFRSCEHTMQAAAPTRPLARGLAGSGVARPCVRSGVYRSLASLQAGRDLCAPRCRVERSTLVDWSILQARCSGRSPSAREITISQRPRITRPKRPVRCLHSVDALHGKEEQKYHYCLLRWTWQGMSRTTLCYLAWVCLTGMPSS